MRVSTYYTRSLLTSFDHGTRFEPLSLEASRELQLVQ